MKRAAIRVVNQVLGVLESQLDELCYMQAHMAEVNDARKLVKQARSKLNDYLDRTLTQEPE